MRQYEATYILDPVLEEEQQRARIDRFKGVVETQGGAVQNVDRWERRRLAYPLKVQREGQMPERVREGYYVVMLFTGVPGVEAELARVLKLEERVLRHIIVKLEPKQAERALGEARSTAEAKARAEAEAKVAAEVAAAAAAVAAVAAEAAAAAAAVAAAAAAAEAAVAAEAAAAEAAVAAAEAAAAAPVEAAPPAASEAQEEPEA